MPPPTPLSIATSSITRLLKEESSYRTELAAQQRRIEGLETGTETEDGDGDGDVEEEGNREWRVRQEKQAIEETKAVFGPLRERLDAAVEKVEGMLESGAPMDEKEVEAAREAVGRAKGG